mmetsp:Transcript_3233/g.7702  ORF Transcript_3233/g.7702 Transcript_3233/m.7702 type:complete len:232 (-) Transcript_3233:157-852(-)
MSAPARSRTTSYRDGAPQRDSLSNGWSCRARPGSGVARESERPRCGPPQSPGACRWLVTGVALFGDPLPACTRWRTGDTRASGGVRCLVPACDLPGRGGVTSRRAEGARCGVSARGCISRFLRPGWACGTSSSTPNGARGGVRFRLADGWSWLGSRSPLFGLRPLLLLLLRALWRPALWPAWLEGSTGGLGLTTGSESTRIAGSGSFGTAGGGNPLLSSGAGMPASASSRG